MSILVLCKDGKASPNQILIETLDDIKGKNITEFALIYKDNKEKIYYRRNTIMPSEILHFFGTLLQRDALECVEDT